jgi:hypothetical protein
MTVLAATTSPSAFWYLTRATGVVSLILLTAAVALGVVTSSRIKTDRWPRFVTAGLHRNVSLLVVVFVVLHVVTTIADRYAPIGIKDAVIPFLSSYRPLWLGFGTLAFDLLLALTATSLLRARIGQRVWRGVHWLAYVSWPVALVHGLGTGTDAKVGWMTALTIGCISVVVAAVLWRIAGGGRERTPARLSAAAASILLPLVILGWYRSGPLRPGWAARAGTPASLLAHRVSVSRAVSRTVTAPSVPKAPFSATLSGTISETSPDANGLVMIQIDTRTTGSLKGVLSLRLKGQALDGGGVALIGSGAALGPLASPAAYTGRVTSLNGTLLRLSLTSASGSRVSVSVRLSIDQARGTVTGTLAARPASSSSGTSA